MKWIVLFNYLVSIQRNLTRTKNHGIMSLLFSVGWIEDKQHSPFSVAFSHKTGLCTVDDIYNLDFLVYIYGINREEPNKNEKSWSYGLTFFQEIGLKMNSKTHFQFYILKGQAFILGTIFTKRIFFCRHTCSIDFQLVHWKKQKYLVVPKQLRISLRSERK